MKTIRCRLLHFFLFAFILIGCKENTSPTEQATKTSLAARSWKGENYVLFNTGTSSRIVKDIVTLFDFRKDGSCTLSQATFSVISVPGQWHLDSEEKNMVLTLNRSVGTVTETLPIIELTSSRFIFGDTTTYGYSLIPL